MIKVLPVLIAAGMFLMSACTGAHPGTADAAAPGSTAAASTIPPDASTIAHELPRDPTALTASGALGVSMPTSAWRVATSHNGSVEEDLISAVSDSGRIRLVVRQVARKLEVYLASGEGLDEVDPSFKGRSVVRCKFDDGEPAQEEWLISRHRTALLFPGDSLDFIGKIRKARRLEVELSMVTDSVDTESFNLALFPEGVISALEKTQ